MANIFIFQIKIDDLDIFLHSYFFYSHAIMLSTMPYFFRVAKSYCNVECLVYLYYRFIYLDCISINHFIYLCLHIN